MAKAYWITCYRSILNPEALAAYAKLMKQVSTSAPSVIEGDSFDKAIAAHDGEAIRLRLLGNAAERDLRIIEAVAWVRPSAGACAAHRHKGRSTTSRTPP
jgi:hypothetical protein